MRSRLISFHLNPLDMVQDLCVNVPALRCFATLSTCPAEHTCQDGPGPKQVVSHPSPEGTSLQEKIREVFLFFNFIKNTFSFLHESSFVMSISDEVFSFRSNMNA